MKLQLLNDKMKLQFLNITCINALKITVHLMKQTEIKKIDNMMELGITKDFFEVIASKLRRAGIINSVRGPGGGYLFNKSRADVTVREIMEAVSDTAKACTLDNLREHFPQIYNELDFNVLQMKVKIL